MVLVHLYESRGVITDVLSATTVDDPRVADQQGFCNHHCGDVVEQGEVAFNILSECFINIFSSASHSQVGGIEDVCAVVNMK
jgi:hypothetical protein